MSASADLQSAIAELLAAPDALRVPVPIVDYKARNLAKKIEAAAAEKSGLSIIIGRPLPARITRDVPFVFVESSIIRVSVCENEANSTNVDIHDLVDDVMNALHWRPRTEGDAPALGAILGYPLQLARTPCEPVLAAGQNMGGGIVSQSNVIDVIFEAVYGFQPTA